MAIFNSEHKWVIGTQAKCGSTSLESLLLRHTNIGCYGLPKHKPPTPSAGYGLERFPRRLMQVRHPYARLASIFSWGVKRAPHEYLSHLVREPDAWAAKFFEDWVAGRRPTFTQTQTEYAEEFGMTRFAKLEEGGLVTVLRSWHPDLPELPTVNANKTHLYKLEEIGFSDKHVWAMIREWAGADAERFGYEL